MIIYVNDDHVSYEDRIAISKIIFSYDNGKRDHEQSVKIYYNGEMKESKVLQLLEGV